MRNLNKDVFDVLRTDAVIKSELGGEFVYQFVKGNDNTPIWITFSELNISPGLYAENEEKPQMLCIKWTYGQCLQSKHN